MNRDFEEWRCSACNRLLFKIKPSPETHIQIKCPNCGAMIERLIKMPPLTELEASILRQIRVMLGI